MKIAIGGLKKNDLEFAIKKVSADIEIISESDTKAAKLVKDGQVDYYFGCCQTGAGASLSMMIALVGYTKCCTVCKIGGSPNKEEIKKFVSEGKLCFGMPITNIETVVPMLLDVLMNQ